MPRKQVNGIPDAEPNKPLYSYGETSKGLQISYDGASHSVERSTANLYNPFTNITDSISVRQGYGREDYETFRNREKVPTKHKDILKQCLIAYRKVGLIQNIIDLMADFGCQGADVVHPDKNAQKWIREWFHNTVSGPQVCERFLNLLYRAAIVPIRSSVAKLRSKQIKKLDFVVGEPNVEVEAPPRVPKNEIPVRYNFLNPTTIEPIEPELGTLVGDIRYGVKLTHTLLAKIKNPKTGIQRELVAKLPDEVMQAVKSPDHIIPLDQEKFSVFFYKKDDWDTTAYPMIYAIFDDLILLQKMKLADLAALDGVISQVRLWRLGSLKEGIMPNAAAINRLSNILTQNVGGGTFDLVWGPELEFQESSTNAHQFLGSMKYEPVLSQIYAGLGVPPTLTGSSTQSGFTNNYISLKTLIERLEYGRKLLLKFWQAELKKVAKAKGWDKVPKLRFTRMSLSDEAAERALLRDLADRDIISVETVLERFGEMPELEETRLKNERKAREDGKLPNKAGPYHNAQLMDDLTKLFVQGGTLTPSQVGLDMPEPKDGEESMMNMKMKNDLELAKQKGVSGQGRPLNSKDSAKRKQRRVLPRSKASEFSQLSVWAYGAQKKINDIILPAILNQYGRSDVRALTSAETETLENVKFGVLYNMKAFSPVTQESVAEVISKKHPMLAKSKLLYNEINGQIVERTGQELILEGQRQLKCLVYSLLKV